MLCEAYVAWLVMCGQLDGTEAEALATCKDSLAGYKATYGPACAVKYDGYLECAAAAECTIEQVCPAEEAAAGDCYPEPGETCMAYGALLASCNPGDDPTELMAQCQIELNANAYYDPPCGAVLEALYKCLAGKTCAELAEGTSCGAEIMAVDTTCMGE